MLYQIFDSPIPEALAPYHPLIARLMARRGIVDFESAEKYLKPDFARDTHDPFLLPDIPVAVDRIIRALEGDEHIVIYSDYDCDGIPGGVILHDFFKKIGYQNFSNYIPDRHLEGYGLHVDAVQNFIAEGKVKVIITVDLGTTNIEAAELAEANGISVVITDHHLPHGPLPKVTAVVNPKRSDSLYPFDGLCGAGVAFKLAQALIQKLPEGYSFPDQYEKWFLDMAGLGTLADQMPLTGENRVLAHFGLLVMRKARRLGLVSLFCEMKMDPEYLVEEDVTFMLAPRLNAASRLDTPRRAFDLLAAEDDAIAKTGAKELSKINDERKLHVAHIMKQVHTVLAKREDKPVIVIGNPTWRIGVLGLVASKIVEQYKKPVFVWGQEGSEVIRGSCRSEGSVHVVDLMTAVGGEFLEFGGHEMAGGFAISHEKIHFLEERLVDASVNHLREKQEEIVVVDAVLTLADVSQNTARQIAHCAPFGLDNPKPLFLFRSVTLESVRMFGKSGEHLELVVADDTGRKKAIAFFRPLDSFSLKLVPGEKRDLLAHIEESHFAGKTEIRLRLVECE